MLEDSLFFSLYSLSCIRKASTTLKQLRLLRCLDLLKHTSNTLSPNMVSHHCYKYHLRLTPPVTVLNLTSNGNKLCSVRWICSQRPKQYHRPTRMAETAMMTSQMTTIMDNRSLHTLWTIFDCNNIHNKHINYGKPSAAKIKPNEKWCNMRRTASRCGSQSSAWSILHL